MTAPSARPRRHDPDRRSRIIDAALDVIASDGVAGVSHRKVAAAADVPLGSMTYHFSGMDELLHDAFTRFATGVSDRIAARMDDAADRDAAIAAVVAHIEEDIFGDARDVILTHELYALAAHDAAYRTLTSDWMRRSRAALERHFDPTSARIVDALVEGLTIHRALDVDAPPPGVTAIALARILR